MKVECKHCSADATGHVIEYFEGKRPSPKCDCRTESRVTWNGKRKGEDAISLTYTGRI